MARCVLPISIQKLCECMCILSIHQPLTISIYSRTSLWLVYSTCKLPCSFCTCYQSWRFVFLSLRTLILKRVNTFPVKARMCLAIQDQALLSPRAMVSPPLLVKGLQRKPWNICQIMSHITSISHSSVVESWFYLGIKQKYQYCNICFQKWYFHILTSVN